MPKPTPRKNDPNCKQLVLHGHIKENGVESEVITFAIRRKDLPPDWDRLVCITNIPDEGKTSAPVYVKIVQE